MRKVAEAETEKIKAAEYAVPIVTPESSAVAPDGRWQNEIQPGALERRPDAPNAEPPALDLGDYGDPEILASLIDKQLEAELLSQIAAVKAIMAMMPGDHMYGRIEKAKGAALKAEWLRRGRTVEELRGRSPDFMGLRV